MVNLNNKYVRVTGVRGDKFIEFDFSIDDPEIFVELILPPDMFHTFCTKNNVKVLDTEADSQAEYDRMLWRIGDVKKNIVTS
jgi:phenol/toluene 2-monooxygenase (NADH) P0/A0